MKRLTPRHLGRDKSLFQFRQHRRPDPAVNEICIDFLYLDLAGCTRCRKTDAVLEDVLHTLEPLLRQANIKLHVHRTQVDTREKAEALRFLSSPTIRINGSDLAEQVTENSCSCCTDLSGAEIDCRVFVWKGHSYSVPPKAMILHAVLNAVSGASQSSQSEIGFYQLPDNLRRFYDAVERKRGS